MMQTTQEDQSDPYVLPCYRTGDIKSQHHKFSIQDQERHLGLLKTKDKQTNKMPVSIFIFDVYFTPFLAMIQRIYAIICLL